MTGLHTENPKRVAVISDTHGHLSEALLREIKGADLIVHAGDICSRTHYETLRTLSPLKLCLGNCDWQGDYPPEVKRLVSFTYAGLQWILCHHAERMDTQGFDIAVCGHTHRPSIETLSDGCTLINPGSPTRPRTQMGPSCARVLVSEGVVVSAEIVLLDY